jgi:hypothetical protein
LKEKKKQKVKSKKVKGKVRNYESVEQPLIYLITGGSATAENFTEKKRKFLDSSEQQFRQKSL